MTRIDKVIAYVLLGLFLLLLGYNVGLHHNPHHGQTCELMESLEEGGPQ